MEILTSRDGATISHDKYGSGPPLVLVHGSMSDHQTSWEAVKGPLSQRFTVYAMDRRGRGQTTAPQERRLEDEFGDVAALLQAVGEPAFVIGHSYGAHCAMGGAAEQPGLVSKLVLYEPPRPSAMSAGEVAKVEEAASRGDWGLVARTFLLEGPKVPLPFVDALQSSPFWPPMVADAPATLSDIRTLGRHQFDPSRFAGLSMPVLLLVGSESPRDNYLTDALAGVLPDRRIVELQGQAHIAHALAPALFVEVVSGFLLAG
jgi:pimeloyl-ACP methyl ester carboxylesterase